MRSATGPATDKKAALKAAIAAERRELADVFDALRAEDWRAPSLCTGWTVREVVAHMSMGMRLSLPATLGELLKARGDLHRMTDRVARRDAAAHTTTELSAFLRDHAHHPWTPPVGGLRAALGHDVVHGLDVTAALGLARRVPEDRLRILLDAIRPSGLRFFGVDLTGVRLCAQDTDWSYGSGAEPVYGDAQDLLLLAFGRRLPPGRLRGGAAGRFTGR
ncbi:maleylpyruvate isomerase family mycothiol-dependent enzyme [Streptomyces vinaceus]|uniref:maleylpyruvate isomerase family mycothiol-dependent enzyme n=1 Tax=Streptomyces vinaceus TaxID=1960 RepID=UPI0038119DDB